MVPPQPEAQVAADPATTSNDDLRVEACGPADRAEQARLFNACFKKEADAAQLAWRYDECPQGSSISYVSRPPVGDAICGYACNPRTVLHRGDESTACTIGETGDVMTHPEWRKRGIFSGLDAATMQATEEHGWVGVFGLPNRRSAHIFTKIGWDRVGTIRPWSFVLRPDARAKAERHREGRLQALGLPWFARRCRAGERALRSKARGEARPLSKFPEEVADLSRRVEAEFDWMVRRDAAYLNWRFLRNPSGLHRALGIYGEDGGFRGYCVIQLPRPGSAVGYLVDVLAPDPDALDAALLAGLEALRGAGASIAQSTAIDGSWWSAQVQRAGFLPPKPDNHLIVIFYTHQSGHPVATAGLDASRWYLTDGDRDDETMG